MKKKTALLFITFLISACSSQNKDGFQFDPRSIEDNSISLSKLCDGISYTPLDNSITLNLVLDNIKYINKSLYLPVSDFGILEFNLSGQLKRRIGRVGRGPGEYTFFVEFTVDPNNKTVYIRDGSRIIRVFSSSGSFLRNISLNEADNPGETLNIFKYRLFVFNFIQFGNSKFNWVIYDTLGNLINTKTRSIPVFQSGWGGGCGTYEFQNRLFYWNIYNDTVFSILPDLTYTTSFIIKPGVHRLPYSNFNPTLLSQFLHIWKVFETEMYYAIIYSYKEPFLLLVEKKNTKSYLSHLEFEKTSIGSRFSGGIVNDLDGGMDFLPKSYYNEDGREFMIGLIYPHQIKDRVASSEFKSSVPKYPEKKKEFEKLANSLKETDNPVLMIVRLKK